jgi:hypothetical protein
MDRRHSGFRRDIDFHTPGKVTHEKISRGDVGKFYDYGWLEHIDGDFRGQNYAISERGRKVVAKGITR